jgi:SNF2 family DNA or RNA helicase
MNKHDFETALAQIQNSISELDFTQKAHPAYLKPYQKIGLQWLLTMFHNQLNCILADDMGLGKTVQSIAFLHEACIKPEKILIIVPLSLLQNWINEFNTFAPSFDIISLYGNAAEREAIKNLHEKSSSILLTTYETANRELDFLSSLNCDLLIIDEAHRLKNKDSLIYKNLSCLNVEKILLLTGTPIQNNLLELHALFKFIKPFMLRRLKNQVLDLPPLKEIVLYCPMTQIQKDLYKSILTRNFSQFAFIKKTGLLNVIMQLRKCTNHPYLFPGIEPGKFINLTFRTVYSRRASCRSLVKVDSA